MVSPRSRGVRLSFERFGCIVASWRPLCWKSGSLDTVCVCVQSLLAKLLYWFWQSFKKQFYIEFVYSVKVWTCLVSWWRDSGHFVEKMVEICNFVFLTRNFWQIYITDLDKTQRETRYLNQEKKTSTAFNNLKDFWGLFLINVTL